MEYKFKCPKCGQTEQIDIPISKYDKLKCCQMCLKCSVRLERVIEWTGSADINGGYESVAGRAGWQQ